MQVRTIGNCVANVNPDTEADRSVRRLIGIENWNLLLHLHSAPHCTVDAIEHYQQRVAASLNNPAVVLLDRGV